MKTFKSNRFGFSLIELMMVLSIISLLAPLATPKIIQFKIRAARGEMYGNVNNIFVLASAYHAQNGVNAPNFVCMHSTTTVVNFLSGYIGGTLESCTANTLGYRQNNPTRLRYGYGFKGEGGLGNSTDAGRQKYFTIMAHSYYRHLGGTSAYATTDYPATKLCKNVHNAAFMNDWWVKFESGVLQLYANNANNDGAATCFNTVTPFL